MASIFEGTSPPAWLVAQEQQTPGELGSIAGTALGGLLNSIQRDPNAPATDPNTGEAPSWLSSRLGLKGGLAEARMNQQDPMWKLKAQQVQTSVWNNVAQLEATHQRLKSQEDESRAWATDLPKINEFSASLKADPNTPPPQMSSIRGLQQVNQMVTQAQMSQYHLSMASSAMARAQGQTAQARMAVKDQADFLKQFVGPFDSDRSIQPEQIPDKL